MALERGPVLVTVEYRVDPARTPEFLDAIRPLRAARLRDGAFRWDLFQDAADPARIVEVFLVESWVEHLRQHERVTEADRTIQEHLLALHQADTPPIVTHLVAGLHRVAKDT
jgi:quinol monooxygenase YgiN